MKQYARLALAAALATCLAAPARADEKTDLAGKVSGALRAAKSFVATTIAPASGLSSTTTYIAPDRVRTDIAAGTTAVTVIAIGPDSYTSRNGAPYTKGTVSAAMRAQLQTLTAVEVSALKPDVTESGTTYGAFETVAGAPPQSVTLLCTYDKKTYRLAKCASEQLIQTFANWDDPKNAIEAPSQAKS